MCCNPKPYRNKNAHPTYNIPIYCYLNNYSFNKPSSVKKFHPVSPNK